MKASVHHFSSMFVALILMQDRVSPTSITNFENACYGAFLVMIPASDAISIESACLSFPYKQPATNTATTLPSITNAKHNPIDTNIHRQVAVKFDTHRSVRESPSKIPSGSVVSLFVCRYLHDLSGAAQAAGGGGV